VAVNHDADPDDSYRKDADDAWTLPVTVRAPARTSQGKSRRPRRRRSRSCPSRPSGIRR